MKDAGAVDVAVGRSIELSGVALEGMGAQLLAIKSARRRAPLRAQRVKAQSRARFVLEKRQSSLLARLVARDEHRGVGDRGVRPCDMGDAWLGMHALIYNGLMLIVRGARVLDPLEPQARPAVRDIAIVGDRIAAVEPPETIPATAGAKVFDARDMLAIPGLVSAHYHSHDTLLKGCFAPMPLEAWLLHAVPPNYAQRSREEIRARVLIGALEALKSGITTLQDMATVHPFDPGAVDTILQAYDDIGIRCVFALQVGDVPSSRPLPFWDELIPPGLRGSATATVRRGGNPRERLDPIDAARKRPASRR